jgi:PAS domain S-box-containing protein
MVPGIIALFNVITGTYVYVNQAIHSILGYQPEEFLKGGIEFVFQLVHPDDAPLLTEQNEVAIRKAREKTPSSSNEPFIASFEYRVRHKNGKWVWLRTNGSVYDWTPSGEPRHMLNVSVDITAQKEAEQSLLQMTTNLEQRVQDRTERLELALKASQMGTWEWVVADNTLTWSDELKKLFGLPVSAEVDYQQYDALIHPDDREYAGRVVEQAMQSGQPYKMEHRIVWSDGSVHWLAGQGQAFLEDGKPVRLIGTSVNIDDRKAAELQLEESEARFRRMADTAPVMIWIGAANGERTYFNEQWLKFTGHTTSQEVGEGWTKAIHPYDRRGSLELYRNAVHSHLPFKLEYRLRRFDGSYRWVIDDGTPRSAPNGEFLGYIGSRMDIHEIKSATAQNRRLEARTAALAKERSELVALNQAKDEFISLASHQLRTPATGVKQYVGMMLEGYAGELTLRQRRMLQTAYESNERELRIVDELLKVAQIDAGKVIIRKQPTNMVSLIRDVISEQTEKFRSREQSITFECASKKLTARVDPYALRMVLENFIDNASKYTLHGKRITVSLVTQGRHFNVNITDQGVGIAKKDMHKLFRKFSRIDNPLSNLVGGTGLGLYWAEKIVSLHGGSIAVDSRLHQGTTFTITVPKR